MFIRQKLLKRLFLFWTLISPGETVVDVTVILGVFLVVLDKKSELPSCFIEASSKIEKN